MKYAQFVKEKMPSVRHLKPKERMAEIGKMWKKSKGGILESSAPAQAQAQVAPAKDAMQAAPAKEAAPTKQAAPPPRVCAKNYVRMHRLEASKQLQASKTYQASKQATRAAPDAG